MGKENKHFMLTPCIHCPYRRDVEPFLRPRRGEELAYHAAHPYNSFTCHKTLVDDPCDDSKNMVGEKSKECAGFMTLQIIEGAKIPEGFAPAYNLVYEDIDHMIDSYNK